MQGNHLLCGQARCLIKCRCECRFSMLEDGKGAGKLTGMFGHPDLLRLTAGSVLDLAWGLSTIGSATNLLLPGPSPGFAEVKENFFLLDSINMSHGMTSNRY